MASRPDFSYIAKLMADPSRATMLDVLLGADEVPASELAKKAGITLQTASSHLSQLVEGHLISVRKQGRHRYYGLASTEVARALETLTVLAPPARINSLKDDSNAKRIQIARTCYDHLAGKLGVSITTSLVEKDYLVEDVKDFIVTKTGESFFEDFNIDLTSLRKKRRYFARKCLDWSERRYHLAGSLGHALLEQFIDQKWIEKMPERTVKITEKGKLGLYEAFAIKS